MVKIIISPPRHRPPRCPHGAGPVSTSPPPPTPSAAASNTSRSFRRRTPTPRTTARTTRRRGGRGRWRSCTLEGKPWKAMEKLGEKVGTYGCIWFFWWIFVVGWWWMKITSIPPFLLGANPGGWWICWVFLHLRVFGIFVGGFLVWANAFFTFECLVDASYRWVPSPTWNRDKKGAMEVWDLDWCVYGVMQSLHPTAMHFDIFWCFLQSCGESRAVKSLKFSTSLTQSDVIGLSWFFLQFFVLTKVQILGSLAAKLLWWPPAWEMDPGNSGVELLGDWKMKCGSCRIKGHLVEWWLTWHLECWNGNGTAWCELAKVLLHKMIPAAEDWWRSWGWTKWIQTFRRIRRTSRGGLNLELKNEAMTGGTTLVENDRPCFTDLRAVMFIKSSSAVHLVLKYDPPRWLCLKIGYPKIW